MASYTLTVNKAAGSISFANNVPSKTWSATLANNTYTQDVTHTGTSAVTYELSNNTCGATISGSTITYTQSGSALVTATVADDDYYTYATKSVSYVLTVNRAIGNISLVSNSGSVDAGGNITISVASSHDGTLSAVATSGPTTRISSITGPVNNAFTVTTNGTTSATVTITVTCAATAYYAAASATYTLTINSVIDVWKNPLYYMAEYNINNYDGTQFSNTQASGYFFNWSTSMSKFAAQTTSYNTYKTAGKGPNSQWHLPTRSEWWSIVPGDLNSNDLASFDTGTGTYKASYISPKWGYNTTTKSGVSESSYWKRISASSSTLEIHAIRFLGTEYCSAWKYVYSNSTHILTISATLIETVANNSTAAANWYNNNFSSVTWGNNAAEGAVMRQLAACGYIASGQGAYGSSGQSQIGEYGKYWSTTEVSDNTGFAYRMFFHIKGIVIDHLQKESGFSVRLFRDN